MVGFNFAPRGWTLCDGQLLSIEQNQALFSLLGTTYVADDRTTFSLPNLEGKGGDTPGHRARADHPFNQAEGRERAYYLTANTMPVYGHSAQGQIKATTDAAGASEPAGKVLVMVSRGGVYGDPQT